MLQEIHDAPAAAVIFLLFLCTSIAAICSDRLYERLHLHPYRITRGNRIHTLLSAGFVHVDILHVIANSWVFYVFAPDLEKTLITSPYNSHLAFTVIYLGGILVGNVATSVMNRNDFTFTSAGASPGIIAACTGYALIKPDDPYFILPLFGPISNLIIAPLYTACLLVYAKRQKVKGIDFSSHFFGAVAGFLLTMLLT